MSRKRWYQVAMVLRGSVTTISAYWTLEAWIAGYWLFPVGVLATVVWAILTISAWAHMKKASG